MIELETNNSIQYITAPEYTYYLRHGVQAGSVPLGQAGKDSDHDVIVTDSQVDPALFYGVLQKEEAYCLGGGEIEDFDWFSLKLKARGYDRVLNLLVCTNEKSHFMWEWAARAAQTLKRTGFDLQTREERVWFYKKQFKFADKLWRKNS